MADIVAKVFLGGRTKFFRAADAFYERRREGPYRFIQNRPGISVVALKSNTAAQKSKDQLSRDFPGRSIFDFCNNIGPKQNTAEAFFMSANRGRRDAGPCSPRPPLVTQSCRTSMCIFVCHSSSCCCRNRLGPTARPRFLRASAPKPTEGTDVCRPSAA
jgi:hypothetical protein